MLNESLPWILFISQLRVDSRDLIIPLSNRELTTLNPLHWFTFPCWLIQATSPVFQSQLIPLSPRCAQPTIDPTNFSAVRRNNSCQIFGQPDSFFIRSNCWSSSLYWDGRPVKKISVAQMNLILSHWRKSFWNIRMKRNTWIQSIWVCQMSWKKS